MKYNVLKITAFLMLTLCYSCTEPIPGCTDENKYNYNSKATTDDGSCIDIVLGCIDKKSLNFNSDANTDDGSCCFLEGCMDAEAENYNQEACIDNKKCYFGILEGNWKGSQYVAGVKFNSEFTTKRDHTYSIKFGMDNSWTNVFNCTGTYKLIDANRVSFTPTYSVDDTETNWEAELKSQSIFFYNEDNDYFIKIKPVDYFFE